MPSVPNDLIDHLCRHSVLTVAQARRVVDEVLAYYDDTLESHVRQRHQQLQAAGMNNRDIFRAIRTEITERPFRSEPLSERQIRRIVYG